MRILLFALTVFVATVGIERSAEAKTIRIALWEVVLTA